jgi:hypothetical protein
MGRRYCTEFFDWKCFITRELRYSILRLHKIYPGAQSRNPEDHNLILRLYHLGSGIVTTTGWLRTYVQKDIRYVIGPKP